MKKKWIVIILLISSNLSFASDITFINLKNTDEKNKVDTLATINSFSHLGDFHTINYSGDYEDILDYLDNLYVGGKSQIFEKFGCSLYSGIGDPENIFFGRNFDNPQQDVLVGKYSAPGCYESVALNRLADIGLPVGTNFNNPHTLTKFIIATCPLFCR